MVLSTSTPDDESRPRTTGWIEQIRLALRLSRAGILLHVDNANHARLGELVRAIAVDHPDVDVSADVRAAETAPEGSVMVLLPRAEDADWLNSRRPIFSRRELKVVLFCDRNATLALAENAVDFFDWISQHHECPEGPPQHAIAGFHAAIAAEAPGIVWMGRAENDVERAWSAFSVACPDEKLQWVLPDRGYARMITDIGRAQPHWIACRIGASTHARRFRWALAETDTRTRAIAVLVWRRVFDIPGFWPVHDRLMPFDEACQRLAKAGATRPSTLAALIGLEPEAVELAQTLLSRKMAHTDFVTLLVQAQDAGAALAKKAHENGLLPDIEAMALLSAPPPVLRALAATPEVRAVRAKEIEEARHAFLKGRYGRGRGVMGIWAATDDVPIKIKKAPEDFGQLSFIIQRLIRQNPDPNELANLATWALRCGEQGPAAWWALLSIARLQRVARPLQKAIYEFDKSEPGRVVYAAHWKQHHEEQMVFAWSGLAATGVALAGVVLPFIVGEKVFNSIFQDLPPYVMILACVMLGSWAIFNFIGRARIRVSIQPEAFSREDTPIEHERLDDFSRRLDEVLTAHAAGRHHQAACKLRELVAEASREYGDEHPNHRRALRELGSVWLDIGNDQEARGCIARAIAIEGRVTSVDHPSFAALMVELSILLQREGAIREAGLLLGKMLDSNGVFELPKDNHDARTEFVQGTDAEVNEIIQLFLAQPMSPLLSAETHTKALRACASWLLTQGRYDETEQVARKALADDMGKATLMQLEALRISSILGRSLTLLGHYDEGVQVLRSATTKANDLLGPNHLDTARFLLHLTRAESREKLADAAITARRALAAFSEADCTNMERAAALDELSKILERGSAMTKTKN